MHQPRIIVDPEVVAVARRAKADQNDPDEEEDYVRSHLSKDADELLWLDYVRWRAVVEVAGADNDDYPGYLEAIGELVAEGLDQGDAGVLSKYLWLRFVPGGACGSRRRPPGSPRHRLL